MTVVELKDVSFGYDSDSKVLHDINLRFEEPGLYCIVGPNGVGKSTVVRCISKILTPQEGQVLIDGRDVRDMTYKEVSQTVSFVPADSHDLFSMSVLNAIMVGRHNKRRWGSTDEDLHAAYRAMKLLHIEKLAQKNFNNLSAGQHQKVNIARGLVQEPKVLMLDEPTSNLDVKYQVYVTEILRGLAKQSGMIVIMICHDLNITAKYADKVIMMCRPGKIYSIGTPDETITSENIENVYGIRSTVIRDPVKDVPVVILGESIMDDDEE